MRHGRFQKLYAIGFFLGFAAHSLFFRCKRFFWGGCEHYFFRNFFIYPFFICPVRPVRRFRPVCNGKTRFPSRLFVLSRVSPFPRAEISCRPRLRRRKFGIFFMTTNKSFQHSVPKNVHICSIQNSLSPRHDGAPARSDGGVAPPRPKGADIFLNAPPFLTCAVYALQVPLQTFRRQRSIHGRSAPSRFPVILPPFTADKDRSYRTRPPKGICFSEFFSYRPFISARKGRPVPVLTFAAPSPHGKSPLRSDTPSI